MRIDTCILKVSANAVSAYQNADVWKEFNIEGIDDTGIETIEVGNMQIYPNPTSDKFIVDFDGIVSIKLYDMLGIEVLFQTANGKTEMNISHLPKGVYSVRVLSEDRIIGNSKIVKR